MKNLLRRWFTAIRFPFGIAGIVLLTTWAIFFAPILAGDRLYFFDDLKIIFYPLEYVYAQFQEKWELPVWSSVFGFGHPLIAWGQLGFFTPLHVLLRFLPLHTLVRLNLSILLYFAVGLAGMHIFLRRQVKAPAAALGALVFVFSGFHVGHLNHVNFYTSTMVLPWLLLAIHHFLTKLTLPRSALLAVVAAVIPMSGQPQVSLYTLLIAALYGLAVFGFQLIYTRPRIAAIKEQLRRSPAAWLHSTFHNRTLKTIILTGLAAGLFGGLASLAILPLNEFLPITERAGGVDPGELYEFSYPPEHGITLIYPYLFGDRENYWGAKGFQELAAYVGILPLLLAGVGLASWRQQRALRMTGVTAVVIAGLFALGKYSPLYTWLVEEHIVQSLTVPGRFVYWFIVGIALLAAVGLNDLLHLPSPLRRWRQLVLAILFPVLTLTPFFAVAGTTPAFARQLMYHAFNPNRLEPWLVGGGILLFLSWWLLTDRVRFPSIGAWSLVAMTAGTLIVYGWSYNPTMERAVALAPSPFTDHLAPPARYEPRIYSSSQPLWLTPDSRLPERATEPVSPAFVIHQPLTLKADVPTCLSFPVRTETDQPRQVTVHVRRDITGPALYQTTIHTDNTFGHDTTNLCLPSGRDLSADSGADGRFFLTFTSVSDSSLRFFYVPASNPTYQVYFVRVPHPEPTELEASRKPFALQFDEILVPAFDFDQALLIRQMNATANTSSARWIGALSIGEYRRFIEEYFANDSDHPIDGDGVHALTRHRKLLDASGVTHLTHMLPAWQVEADPVLAAGFALIDEQVAGTTHFRLYRNPAAAPKAYLVPTAAWKPSADEARHAMGQPEFEPRQLVFINGDKPPPDDWLTAGTLPSDATTEITNYTSSSVSLQVSTSSPAWLVLTDAYTPQWSARLNGIETPVFSGQTVFRTVYVPAGQHTVEFSYDSPAITQAVRLSVLAGVGAAGCGLLPLLHTQHWQYRRRRRRQPPAADTTR